MMNDFRERLRQIKSPIRRPIVKHGTIAIGVVETTPVVWEGRLLRFEWVRNHGWGKVKSVTREVGCYRFVDMETNCPVGAEFALDHSFGCCYAEDGVMYVIGTRGPGGGQVLDLFVSRDLVTWEEREILSFPADISLFNTSLCRGEDGYMLAIEIGGTHPAVGRPFTGVFAHADRPDGDWQMLPMEEYVYDPSRYTACPTIRYYDGWYYIINLESAPLHRYISYIVRTRDFKNYELGDINPVMMFDDGDKRIEHPEYFSAEEIATIENAANCNNSDIDLCEYNGKTVILYSWGNQLGREFLAWAEYDGTEQEFLESYFR